VTFLFGKEISVRKSLFKSLILPGWGELSAGNKSGYGFIATEVALWSIKFYFANEQDLVRTQSEEHAERYAHLNKGDYSDDFYRNMTRFKSSGFEAGGYNENIMMQAQNISDEEVRRKFLEKNLYGEEQYWNWDDNTRQGQFRKLRNNITDYSELTKAMTGTLIANHILSAINAARISYRAKKLDVKMSFNTKMKPYFMFSCGL